MFAVLAAFAIANVAPFAFSVSDDVADRRFVLEFRNLGSTPLCLSPATWPNEHGIIPLTSAKISVTVGTQSFPLATFIEDFATQSARVKPKATAKAYLDYAAFRIPDGVATKSKVLHLTPAAVACE